MTDAHGARPRVDDAEKSPTHGARGAADSVASTAAAATSATAAHAASAATATLRGPGRVARRLSVSTRVALVIVGVAIACLAATALVGVVRGTALAESALETRLSTITAARSDDLLRHLDGLRSRLGAEAASPATADAIGDFAAAMDELAAEPVSRAQVDELTDFYVDVVAPPLAEVRGDAVSQSSLLPVTDAAVRLQTTWTITEEGENPALVDDAGDGTTWSAVNAAFHPAYRKFAAQAGFDDMWLVDADNRIVYSVNKGIDLGTSLEVGPHSGGVLAAAVADVAADPQPGQVVIGDLGLSTTAGGQPIGVVASPVFDGDRFVGVVAGSYDGAILTDIMTDDADFSDLGATGQSYLAAADATMRSDDRLFLEDPDAWEDAASAFLTSEQVGSIQALGTTVTLAPVDEQLVQAAGDAPGIEQARGPTGEEVVAAHRALPLDGLDWVAVTQLDRAEAEAPLGTFVQNLLITMALFVAAVTFVGVAWANRFTHPLRAASQRLRLARLHGGLVAQDAGAIDLVSDAPREYLELSRDIELMLARLDQRHREVQQRADERIALLRQFLPASVVHRAEAGEQDVVDQVSNATVAVVVLRGLGDLVRGGDKEETRDLLARLVDDLDALALAHGLDRLRLGGDSYHAVAGASRPLLDHAPRAAHFALDVRELVADLDDHGAGTLAVGVGLASGPVTVGLTSGARLVFDGWGPTVDRAGKLARAAAAGHVLTDEATTRRLPDVFTTTDGGLGEGILDLTGRAVGSEES